MSIELNIFRDMLDELTEANKQYPPFKNLHEAYAVMLEELDEVWDEIKMKQVNLLRLEQELLQVGAMAAKAVALVRYLKGLQ